MPTLPAAGIVLVDKPEGWTSHDVVAFLRPILGTRRVGHAGTLDPLASGLLVVLYGHATRLATELHLARKTYLADVVLGAETTTDDREGAASARAEVPELDDGVVRGILARFVGRQLQVPPAYSAIHVGGRRAYARSRRGETVLLGPRPIEIDSLELLARERGRIRLRVVCSSGTYVRALARDLGRALGTRAHLGGLRRLAIGPFVVDEAVTPDQLRGSTATELADRVLPEDAARRLLAGPEAETAPSRPTERDDQGKGAT